MVDLILLERVEKLGQMGQVVKVKPGYARNYLLPQKKAMRATKENLAYFELSGRSSKPAICSTNPRPQKSQKEWKGSRLS